MKHKSLGDLRQQVSLLMKSESLKLILPWRSLPTLDWLPSLPPLLPSLSSAHCLWLLPSLLRKTLTPCSSKPLTETPAKKAELGLEVSV